MPEAGAVEPATPMAMPLSVRIRASAARLSGAPRCRASANSSAARDRVRRAIPALQAGSPPGSPADSRAGRPRTEARYQSALAVNIAIMSPTPARLRSGGADASTSVSAIRTSGHRDGVVRLTPSRSSTEKGSAKPLTLVGVNVRARADDRPAQVIPLAQRSLDDLAQIVARNEHWRRGGEHDYFRARPATATQDHRQLAEGTVPVNELTETQRLRPIGIRERAPERRQVEPIQVELAKGRHVSALSVPSYSARYWAYRSA